MTAKDKNLNNNLFVTEIYKIEKKKILKLPFYNSSVSAGFPSPAEDYIEKHLDLNEFLIPHPASTFLVRVSGYSMVNAGIHSGDILVVDRSLKTFDKNIVVAIIDGEFTVKRLRIKKQKLFLEPESDLFEPIEISDKHNFEIWGIVTAVIRQL